MILQNPDVVNYCLKDRIHRSGRKPDFRYELFPLVISFLLSLPIVFASLIAARIVSTVGTFVSLPDLSLNILQENPTNPWGCNSFPLIKTEGDPVIPIVIALLSSIL